MAAPSVVIKAVITTIDNLLLLQQQLRLLQRDALITGIVVVNNGSVDGTREWLAKQTGLTVINRENRGAGPGRNAGLDAAGAFDYVLMLDGGIRPLPEGTARMFEYLQSAADVDVVGVEFDGFVTDESTASSRWDTPIGPTNAYRNTRLSHTAYCFARARAFAGLRFSETGPFAEPGWGVDDDEMMYQWNEAGIVLHVVVDVHPYRRAAGSFERLFRETGIWPNQYGSTYEQRLVYCQQNWPQYQPGVQWGEPWLTVLIQVDADYNKTVRLIRRAHEVLRADRCVSPWTGVFHPYSVVVLCPRGHPFLIWAEPRRLRQHHGDTIVVDGQIVRRSPENEDDWTGDFRVFSGDDPQDAVRRGAHYYGIVSGDEDLDALVAAYFAARPDRQAPPVCRRGRIDIGPPGTGSTEHPFDVFATISCINLETRPDRWALAVEELGKLNLTQRVVRFAGIVPGGNTPSALGCSLSHLAIIREAKQRGVENVLVLEDDVVFVNDPLGTLRQVSAELTQLPWDILYLGATTHERLERVSDSLVRIRDCHSTHAICYHRRIYDYILERANHQSAIDIWLRHTVQPTFNCYGTNPLIATQRPSYSDILQGHVDYAFIEANYRMNTAHIK